MMLTSFATTHRLEDVRLEQADLAAGRTSVSAPPVLGEHLVVYAQFAYPHEFLQFFTEFPDVILDTGYEVCLHGVPVAAKPIHRHFGRVFRHAVCFHANNVVL